MQLKTFAVTAALAAGLATMSAPARAWVPSPWWGSIPQPVTVLLHAAGGFALAAWLDHRAGTAGDPDARATMPAAMGIAGGIGLAKELADVTFYWEDFLAWPAGAWLYYHVKASPHCFGAPPGEEETDWYIPRKGCIPRAPAAATAATTTKGT